MSKQTGTRNIDLSHFFLAKNGIQFRPLCLYIHAQNGKVEKKHIHFVELGLTLLAEANMPLFF